MTRKHVCVVAVTFLAAVPAAAQDSSFGAMQARGGKAMGVDQYTSAHQFDALADGGRIELQRQTDDSAGIMEIRRHMQDITHRFQAGDFTIPGFVHDRPVPGAAVMAARRDKITYAYHPLPRGGEVRILTHDAQALEAIRQFMAFQRQDHRAGGMDHGTMDHGAGHQ